MARCWVYCHHADCADMGRARVWRENCLDCAEEVASRHRRETGHEVNLNAESDEDVTSSWELRRMTLQAHRSLYGVRRMG